MDSFSNLLVDKINLPDYGMYVKYSNDSSWACFFTLISSIWRIVCFKRFALLVLFLGKAKPNDKYQSKAFCLLRPAAPLRGVC